MFPLLLVLSAAEVDERALQAIERYASVYEHATALGFTLRKVERLRDGSNVAEEVRVKFRKPGDVYLAAIKPKPGQEVLYVPTIDKTKLRAHPGRFPDVTVMLDIHGGMALDRQHHPIYHLDPAYGVHILKAAVKEARSGASDGKARYIGESTRYGRAVEVVQLEAGSRSAKKEKPRPGERLIDFALRHGADPYVTYVANPSIGALNSKLDAGKEYTLPAYYGRRNELAFDTATGFMLEQRIFDGEGRLYEQVAYLDLVIDPPFTDADFDFKNPAYKF